MDGFEQRMSEQTQQNTQLTALVKQLTVCQHFHMFVIVCLCVCAVSVCVCVCAVCVCVCVCACTLVEHPVQANK